MSQPDSQPWQAKKTITPVNKGKSAATPAATVRQNVLNATGKNLTNAQITAQRNGTRGWVLGEFPRERLADGVAELVKLAGLRRKTD
jgi:hypothetical protein